MTQSGMGQQHLNKCAHAGCVCVVEPSQTYCSEFCASVSDVKTSAELPGRHMEAGGHCDCGHDACEHAHVSSVAQPSGLHGSTAGAGRSATSDAKLHEAARETFHNTGEN